MDAFIMNKESQEEVAKRQKQLVETWTQRLSGKQLVEKPQGEQALDEKKQFTVDSLPTNHRILKGPNAAMTLDFRPDRLNVHLDENGQCSILASILIASPSVLCTVFTFPHGQQAIATVTNRAAHRGMSRLAAQSSATRSALELIEPMEQIEMPTGADGDADNKDAAPAVFSASSFPTHRSPRTRSKASINAAIVVHSSTVTAVAADTEAETEAEDMPTPAAFVGAAGESGPSTDLAQAISEVLVDSSTGMVAGADFSSLLLSAIDSASGNLPVIGI
ncbi:hypothetical protein GGI15_003723 [Coemansia interrupta]|uniref:Uncharacterized protein n=1 Tax=Coemansia interrupta TaxID=1126814 RepID=A0A9W8LI46_9FUNG|nr:hypothetical protein GGI15_003723 [Coemansia interrupta]